MKMRQTIAYGLRGAAMGAALALCTSCVEEVNLDDLRPDPTLVVNAVAMAGEPLAVDVTRTWFYTDLNPEVTVSDAEVALYVNDAFRERVAYQPGDSAYNVPGRYRSAYVPVTGDRLRIEVSHPTYGKATAQAEVPALAPFVAADRRLVDLGNYESAIYEITLRDSAGSEDFYWLRMEEGIPVYDAAAKRYTGDYKWMGIRVDYATEPVIGDSFTALDYIFGTGSLWMREEGVVFSDELFDGQAYTLRFTNTYYYDQFGTFPIEVVPDSVRFPDLPEEEYTPIPPRHLRVYLYTLSADYYYYLKAIQDAASGSISGTFQEIGLAEPVRTHSNIEGGVGILGGCHTGVFEVAISSSATTASTSRCGSAGSVRRDTP